jgi:hypothetical protein
MNHNLFWAVLLRPFFVFALAVVVLYPARRAVQKHMRDGKLKRLLLRRIN